MLYPIAWLVCILLYWLVWNKRSGNVLSPSKITVRAALGGVSSQRRSRFERATWLLATFVRSHRSLHSLAPQRYAPFTGSLTHFAHSLVGQLKIVNMCSRCYRVSWVQTRCLSSLETRPKCHCQRHSWFVIRSSNETSKADQLVIALAIVLGLCLFLLLWHI